VTCRHHAATISSCSSALFHNACRGYGGGGSNAVLLAVAAVVTGGAVQQSPIRWASRWDTYLLMHSEPIHWFSIINSLMIVLFLTGMVAMIMLRTLHRDIAKYNQLESADEAQVRLLPRSQHLAHTAPQPHTAPHSRALQAVPAHTAFWAPSDALQALRDTHSCMHVIPACTMQMCG
jgi:hypothetical protein